MLVSGAMVFLMQAGFAMLEAGIVQPKNISNILFKVGLWPRGRAVGSAGPGPDYV